MKHIFCAFLLLTGLMAAAVDVMIISDSTAVDYRGKRNPYTKGKTLWAPMSGWGEFAADACQKGTQLVNCAIGGYSSRTFAERRLQKTARKFTSGGWLLLSFGSNDARPNKTEPQRNTTADKTYPEYLGMIASAAQKAGMKVVIISPPPFYNTVDGKFANPVLAPYAVSAKKFAKANGYYFIDLFTAMSGYLAQLSDKDVRSHYMFLARGESANWPKGRKDPLHFTQKGSKLIWQIIQQEIDRKIPELAKCFKPLAN